MVLGGRGGEGERSGGGGGEGEGCRWCGWGRGWGGGQELQGHKAERPADGVTGWYPVEEVEGVTVQ